MVITRIFFVVVIHIQKDDLAPKHPILLPLGKQFLESHSKYRKIMNGIPTVSWQRNIPEPQKSSLHKRYIMTTTLVTATGDHSRNPSEILWHSGCMMLLVVFSFDVDTCDALVGDNCLRYLGAPASCTPHVAKKALRAHGEGAAIGTQFAMFTRTGGFALIG